MLIPFSFLQFVGHVAACYIGLIRPPTQTSLESAFSSQTWLLSGRRAFMTHSSYNSRMVGRPCKRLKRRMQEANLKINTCKKQKLGQLSYIAESNFANNKSPWVRKAPPSSALQAGGSGFFDFCFERLMPSTYLYTMCTLPSDMRLLESVTLTSLRMKVSR